MPTYRQREYQSLRRHQTSYGTDIELKSVERDLKNLTVRRPPVQNQSLRNYLYLYPFNLSILLIDFASHINSHIPQIPDHARYFL